MLKPFGEVGAIFHYNFHRQYSLQVIAENNVKNIKNRD